jgi:hypothetical protein
MVPGVFCLSGRCGWSLAGIVRGVIHAITCDYKPKCVTRAASGGPFVQSSCTARGNVR